MDVPDGDAEGVAGRLVEVGVRRLYARRVVWVVMRVHDVQAGQIHPRPGIRTIRRGSSIEGRAGRNHRTWTPRGGDHPLPEGFLACDSIAVRPTLAAGSPARTAFCL